jgi:phospholipid transport system substrate-binding protein
MSQTFAIRRARTQTRALALALAASVAVAASLAQAQATDPAAQRIESFDTALLGAWKSDKSVGAQGRAKVLAPAVEATFDLPAMARFAVGPTWTTIAPDDQAALLKSFSRFTIANYAKNFKDYSGQKLVVQPGVETRGLDKLVKTQLIDGSNTIPLAYRMRQSAGGPWKVIDVFYNGSISQLTTQRSDFSSTLTSGGAKALVAKLDAQTEKLLK